MNLSKMKRSQGTSAKGGAKQCELMLRGLLTSKASMEKVSSGRGFLTDLQKMCGHKRPQETQLSDMTAFFGFQQPMIEPLGRFTWAEPPEPIMLNSQVSIVIRAGGTAWRSTPLDMAITQRTGSCFSSAFAMIHS
jgi:hypothetical protein